MTSVLVLDGQVGTKAADNGTDTKITKSDRLANCVSDKGEGVQKPEKFADVIEVWPLLDR